LLKIWKDDDNATYFPHGELVYVPKDLNFDLELDLCYQFEINSDEPLLRKNVFVHAATGAIWAVEDLLHQTDVKGTANTKYRGVRTITTDSVSPGTYRLREVGRGKGIETYNMRKGTNYSTAVDFTDGDNYWNNYNSNFDEIAGDAHFGAEMTYDYFQERFNRNSFDNNGAKIRSYVHYANRYVNAFWNGSVMTYGDGNGTSYTPLTSIDICGHEVSHAVTTNSANLVYSYESGALNESFSDIFGNAIEYYTDSTQFSWRMGEDIMASANGIRNMSNPKTHRDPTTYKGQYWHTRSSDNGGVHTNSGVQNFWFYLLCEGRSGTNDNNDTYTVDSIGIRKAEQIAYRNLTVYLTRTSKYDDARYYGIQSAVDLYGFCSKEVEATTNAWYAVGVGDEYDSSLVVADFMSDTAFCRNGDVVQFTNLSTNASKFEWSFGDGSSSTAQNPAHAYNSQQYFTVQLIAEGCYKGVKDTMVKTNYLLFDSTRHICNSYLLPQRSHSRVNLCDGYIYDHAGEGRYEGLSRDTLVIDFSISDSAHLTFLEFDYENGYDSVYVYSGYNTQGILLGGFTGQTLPNGGKPLVSYTGGFTVTHFSDPYVVGTGFKARFEAFRPALKLTRTPDTTVCYKQPITIEAFGSGGSAPDRVYYWNGIPGSQRQSFVATKDTVIYLRYREVCMKQELFDTIRIIVRDSIEYSQTSDTIVCQGADFNFSIKPKGGLGTYWFTSDNGSTVGPLTELVSARQNLTPGAHDFWVRITDGCTETFDTAFFQGAVRDSLRLTLSNDTTICDGTVANHRALASGGIPANHLFDWGDGPVSNSDLNIQPKSDTTVRVRLLDGCSSYEPVLSVQTRVLDPISAQIIGSDTACYGETITLSYTSTGGKDENHVPDWNMGNSSSSSFNVTVYKDTSISLVVADGCTPKSGVDQHSIVVRSPLTLQLPADTSICFGQSVTIEALASGGLSGNHTIEWNQNQGLGGQKTLTPPSTTTYTIGLTDNCSEAYRANYTVTVNPLPRSNFELAENPTCTGVDVFFTNRTVETSKDDYTWYLGDGTISGDRNAVHAYSNTGVYTIKLISRNEFGCIDSMIKERELEVFPHPVSDFFFTPTHPDFLNKTVEFSNHSEHATSFNWTFGDGSQTSLDDPSHTYPDSGRYTITLVASNGIGCSHQRSKELVISDAFVLYIPNAVSPNHDEINDQFGFVVRGMQSYTIRIFNEWGEIVHETSMPNNQWDGFANKKKALLGTYHYWFEGIDMNGNEVLRSGPIYLVR
ncbi:MAG: M4 family metallopeptidase, partial [Bacteroidia bacterium]|nr:M4 family metallopeptidase [Bacteroidia bacterium]